MENYQGIFGLFLLITGFSNFSLKVKKVFLILKNNFFIIAGTENQYILEFFLLVRKKYFSDSCTELTLPFFTKSLYFFFTNYLKYLQQY